MRKRISLLVKNQNVSSNCRTMIQARIGVKTVEIPAKYFGLPTLMAVQETHVLTFTRSPKEKTQWMESHVVS